MLRLRKVVWLSHAYGYFADFMYWGPLLSRYASAFPNTVILSQEKMVANNVYGLPLDPSLHVYNITIKKPTPSGDYGIALEFPHPSIVFHLLKHKPDLLILNDFSRVTWLGAFVARLLPRCRILLLVEAHPKFRGVEHKGIHFKIRQMVARQADAVLVNQRESVGYLTRTLGVDPDRVIERPYLTSQPGEARSVGNQPTAAATEDRLRFLFLNTISHRKGTELLVRAVAAVDPERRKRMFVRIVGDGPLRTAVEALTNELQLRDTIEFVGRVPYAKIADYYRAADVVVVPTLLDYGGMTTFEALSFGLPMLLSSRAGYCADVLREGENGLSVDPKDLQGFADKLSWFVDHRERLPAMRQVSVEINKRFTVESVVNNLIYASERALTRS